MNYKIIQPSALLKPYVRYYWILDISKDDLPYTQHLMPHGRMELFFYLNEPQIGISDLAKGLNKVEGIFTGFFKHYSVLHHFATFRAVGISFYPWAGNMLFQTPVNHFSNRFTLFSDIDPTSSLIRELLEVKNDVGIGSCFEQYLKSRLSSKKLDEITSFLSKEILKTPFESKLQNAITTSVGLSKRRIEQRFLSSIGVPMSFFLKISRFEKAMEMMSLNQHSSLTQLGLDAGYFDQSHFTRDFKHFSDSTPKSFKQNISTKEGMKAGFIDLYIARLKKINLKK